MKKIENWIFFIFSTQWKNESSNFTQNTTYFYFVKGKINLFIHRSWNKIRCRLFLTDASAFWFLIKIPSPQTLFGPVFFFQFSLHCLSSWKAIFFVQYFPLKSVTVQSRSIRQADIFKVCVFIRIFAGRFNNHVQNVHTNAGRWLPVIKAASPSPIPSIQWRSLPAPCSRTCVRTWYDHGENAPRYSLTFNAVVAILEHLSYLHFLS